MAFLYFLADAFINTFGITQPSPQARKQAAIFIVVMLVLVVIGAWAAFFLVHSLMK